MKTIGSPCLSCSPEPSTSQTNNLIDGIRLCIACLLIDHTKSINSIHLFIQYCVLPLILHCSLHCHLVRYNKKLEKWTFLRNLKIISVLQLPRLFLKTKLKIIESVRRMQNNTYFTVIHRQPFHDPKLIEFYMYWF